MDNLSVCVCDIYITTLKAIRRNYLTRQRSSLLIGLSDQSDDAWNVRTRESYNNTDDYNRVFGSGAVTAGLHGPHPYIGLFPPRNKGMLII
jgi:hypothetical protein